MYCSAKNSNGRVGKEGEDALAINFMEVDYNGQTFWYPGITSVSYCPVDVRWFPFDEQQCSLDYELWAMDNAEVNLTALHTTVGTEKLTENGEWEITGKYTLRSIYFFLRKEHELFGDKQV